ncbi:MAG: hypothetical protein JXR07_17640 [Reichenbachiella sp.]
MNKNILSIVKKTVESGFLICALLSVLSASAQDIESDYLKAKEYLKNGEYPFAIDLFSQISKGENALSEYASFYYGLSAYKNDQLGLGRSIWLKMAEENENWTGISDVYYWLSKVYFEENNFDKGVHFAKKSGLSEARPLMIQELSKIDSIPIIEEVYYIYPFDKDIAEILADRLVEVSISERNFQLLQTIVEKHELDPVKYGFPKIGKSTLKNEYKVAVLLPFYFNGLENASRTARNRFVMDLYTGMQEAAYELNLQEGARIKLVPYDTKRDTAIVTEILSLDEMKSMDLIVGPLFPDPVRLVSDFSFENKINMINPLSVNSEFIRYNPYSFLFKPTVETQSLVVAQMTVDSVKNKYAMIFYENNTRDSLSAFTYSQRIQEGGFEVLVNQAVVDTTIQASFEMLTEKYENIYTEEQKDSVLLIDESKIFKERKSIEEKDVVEYYEEFFKIAPDSIGHIFVASSKPLFASSIISAVEVRNDSTIIVGRGAWKNFETITFEELERLGVILVDPDYIDRSSEGYKSLRSLYIKKYHDIPSVNNMLGYEMMDFAGSMLKEFGNYFQNGTNITGFRKSKLYFGTNFQFANSNQFVPITKLSKSKTTVINSPE